MSQPKGAAPVRQLAAWIPAKLKERLEKRAEREKKAERAVVAEALEKHLKDKSDPAGPGEPKT